MKTGRMVPMIMAFLLGANACRDLQIDNVVNPDRARATGNARDLEAFIGGAFYQPLFQALHTNAASLAGWPLIGAELTGTGEGVPFRWNDFKEPRVVHDNGAIISVGDGPHGPRLFWASSNAAASIVYDGLQILAESGMKIPDEVNPNVDRTPRAQAYAKFIQGWSWGYQAIIFDRAHHVPETMDTPQGPVAMVEMARATLVEWPALLGHALESLEAAKAIARDNPTAVDFPSLAQSALWFGSAAPISNEKFIQMANTLAARLIVLSARTPADRVSLDWARVEALTREGLTSDFAIALNTTRSSGLVQRAQQNVAGATNNYRLDYRGTVGLADQSGAFQEWLASSLNDRRRFDVVTPDRRITGETPQSNGSYVRYRADDNGFRADRGLYLFSAYQWGRHATGLGLTAVNQVGHNAGTWAMISKTENDLLRAEALYYLNRRDEAAELVNLTRTAPQTIGGTTYPGLPPATAAGVPMDENGHCVPRQESGACGALLTAIRYERMLELIATDLVRGYADSRGWGILPDGTILSWPVPGNALDMYDMEPYTYGGVGQPNTATYAPVN